jgi:hypothetical protein
MEASVTQRLVEKIAAEVDPLVPLDQARSMDEVIGRARGRPPCAGHQATCRFHVARLYHGRDTS